MSMSTHVVGFKPPNEKWKKMKAIWDSCEDAGVEIPEKVWNYFNDNPPDDAGVRVEIEGHKCCRKYNNESESGFTVRVEDLPRDVTLIRFTNCW